MKNYFVVSNPQNWPLNIPEVEVISAKAYLTDSQYLTERNAKIFNLCRSYRYQSSGYYVSLLAAARGHKPLPSVQTIQDLKSPTMARLVSDELDELIQQSLADVNSSKFTLSIYFGHNLSKCHERLSQALFRQFQAPLLIAQFAHAHGKWSLQNISPLIASEIPPDHHDFVVEMAKEYFNGKRVSCKKKANLRYDLAVLHNPEEKNPPSNEKALQRFIKAAESVGFNAELITKDDYSRLAEFDALFIRETTSVNHHTYRFARRGSAENLVVVDDPDSILKCTNKVYLAEVLERYHISAPKTVILHQDNADIVCKELGFPCVLKQPDSSFSNGVVKVNSQTELYDVLPNLLDKSDLLIAQEFIPTPFDWRVCIFDRKPLFACRYYMARKHWQIYERLDSGKTISGKSDTLPVGMTPKKVIRAALKAANLIGDGFYGVDLKELDDNCYVIEINDNPSIDAGVEDIVLQEDLYQQLMGGILKRVEARKNGGFLGTR